MAHLRTPELPASWAEVPIVSSTVTPRRAEWARLSDQDRTLERAARRELRRQIGRLEAELASYLRDLPRDRGRRHRRREAHVAGIEELEAIRDMLLHRLCDARAAAADRAAREGLARERRDAMVADPGSHRGLVISSKDAGERGCVSWEVEPRYGPLGVLMNWWRVKVSGGCPLAAPREAASG